ncbi:uncharacterized protein N7500_004372 [Penicillium coprophilum]|uniref:uncharacterized protein n=1 Tax=Penicillium coprophilum TaxID=36646 RepID=UPI0023828B0E|nr:uncharacterized protein N7500_004372 [Penicillium coprophilum]KAJ5171589.1 hypothetical protein N7500_004372 [Penicillium coprophilum]
MSSLAGRKKPPLMRLSSTVPPTHPWLACLNQHTASARARNGRPIVRHEGRSLAERIATELTLHPQSQTQSQLQSLAAVDSAAKRCHQYFKSQY